MTRYLVPGLVGLMYAGQGIYHAFKGEYGYAIMWFAYGLANLGICLAMAEGQEGH